MNRIVLVAVALVSLVGAQAQGSITFDGFGVLSGNSLHAQATFDFGTPGFVVVTLTNLGDPAEIPAHVLTTLFFDLTNNPTLSKTSVVLGSGSSVINNGPTGDLGKEYVYKNNLVGVPSGAGSQGLGSAGLGLFGEANLFVAGDLNPNTVGPDGQDYGLVNSVAPNANNPVKTDPLIQNSVVMTLDIPAGFTLGDGDVSNVFFQYGTSLTAGEPGFSPGPPVVPEPASVVIWGVLGAGAAAGLAIRRRRPVAARTPWSEENRNAIFGIVERGRR